MLCKRDFGFLTALLLLSASVLLRFRGNAFIENKWQILILLILWSGVITVWVRNFKRTDPLLDVDNADKVPPKASALIERLLLPAFLFVFTLVGYFIPLRKCYWHGYDDAMTICMSPNPLWIADLDTTYNRPFAFLQANIAHILTPDSIDGFLCLAICFHFLSSILLYLILKRLLKQNTAVPLIAAILLIINPAEPLRFMTVAMSH